MSRSYKHSPVHTDGKRGRTKYTKSLANRMVRRRDNRVVKGYLDRDPIYRDEMVLDGKAYKKYYCSWNIHDYVMYWDKFMAIMRYEHPHWRYSSWTGTWHHPYEEFETLNDFLNKSWKKTFYRK